MIRLWKDCDGDVWVETPFGLHLVSDSTSVAAIEQLYGPLTPVPAERVTT